ncbi:ABC transporter ATP-binding protein [Streptomyces sp. PSKA54]|uniref:ABC transporter ATP-binding protein n=1 Tax=Streptomyces himalayensis subsp. aureolus TaxID=2758039 RepID=A0A7W2HJ15_9ACTN|nr:ABC transporter ATP-binding protein [Streptomyces himalayensis]MBA4865652.1 ABC transporter ATP-binding protein [Streptomyces himalayensis subsp. aureolus]
MARIEVEKIVKRYDGVDGAVSSRPALDTVSLDIADGETIAVVGSSGCGKSSLLKIVAGLEQPDEGVVRFDGEDVTAVRPQQRGVGMVFQDYALYPSMKGKGNLSYYFQVQGRTEEEARARAKETADRMGIGFEQLLDQATDTLSGGQQQRVAIARCIVREPRLFLMDEPICNLDAKLRESTRVEIRKLLRKFGISTLYVTHDQQEAVFMGDRIAVMRDGRIEQVGTFDEVYYSPANLFVATFIGSPPMAVLPGIASGGRLTVAGGAVWPAPVELPDGPVRLGVRPESWFTGRGDGALLQVSHIERIPTERAAFVHGQVEGVPVVVAAPLNQPDSAELRIMPDMDRVYVFSADDERPLHTPGPLDLF